MQVGLHLMCLSLLSDFNEYGNVSTEFSTNPKYEVSTKTRPVGVTSSTRTDWRTDMKKLAGTLRFYKRA
jgi:hypothetical protein